MSQNDPTRCLFPYYRKMMKLYVGIDIGKKSHYAGFLSRPLLSHFHRVESCPTLSFQQSREGFHELLARMRSYAPLAECAVLVEHTGHYAFPLLQYLFEMGISCYMLHVHEKGHRKQKSDKRDALVLARQLYNEVELGVQPDDTGRPLHPLIPPSSLALRLHALVQRNEELTRDIVRHLNRLTAICDELFPEFTQVFKNPNKQHALTYREHFPTPASLKEASMADLRALRIRSHPSNKQLALLQQLASESIGIKSTDRQYGLLLEQKQLIAELRLLQSYQADLEREITAIVSDSREGKILLSIPAIGPIQAATIIAHIGTIANFRSASDLKGYCGWSPRQRQTGTTIDSMKLARGGNRSLRQVFYMATMVAIGHDTEFAALYQRLLPLKGSYNPRKKKYIGAKKVFGRVAGQLITLVYALLRHDYDVLSSLKDGEETPAPVLYDRTVHHAARNGRYVPLKKPHAHDDAPLPC